jgi:hypothetical protein
MRRARSIALGATSLVIGLVALAALAYAAGSPPSSAPPPQAGQVKIAVSGLSGFGMRDAVIGDSTVGALTISNTGNLTADVSIKGATTQQGTAVTALTQKLRLVVYRGVDNAGIPVYSGTLQAFDAAPPLALGMLARAASGSGGGTGAPSTTTLFLHVTFTGNAPADDNALAGLGSVDQRFTVSADQHAGR